MNMSISPQCHTMPLNVIQQFVRINFMYLHVPSRKPHPSGCSRAAFNTGHIAASHHHCPADDLLSEVNKPAHTIRTYSICLSEWIPALSLLWACEWAWEWVCRVRASGRGWFGNRRWAVASGQTAAPQARQHTKTARSGQATDTHSLTNLTNDMRRNSAASLRWLILVLVFVVCLPYVLNSSAL